MKVILDEDQLEDYQKWRKDVKKYNQELYDTIKETGKKDNWTFLIGMLGGSFWVSVIWWFFWVSIK